MATRRTNGSETPTDPVKVLVGRNIARARVALDWSQTTLAREAGFDDGQMISKWERGVYMPSNERLLALARALGRDLSWFYTNHDEEPVAA